MFEKINTEWTDGLQPGGRAPRLFVIDKSGNVCRFTGESIPGVLAVTGEGYNKNGKWSSTTYQLKAARGVALVESLTPLHQVAFSEYGSWSEVAAAMAKEAGVHVDAQSVETALRSAYIRSNGIAPLDERQAALDSLESSDVESADVVLSAFSPNMLHLDTPVEVRFTPICIDEARALADGAPSAVGHADTARVFSQVLGVDIQCNRVNATLQAGVVALVGQYRGPRLAEGATELPDGSTIVWLRVELI